VAAHGPHRPTGTRPEWWRRCHSLLPGPLRWACAPFRLSLVARFTLLSVAVTAAIAAAAAWAMGRQVEAYVVVEAAREAGVPFPQTASEQAALLTPPLVEHVREMQRFIVVSVVGGFGVLYLTLFAVVRGAALQLARQNQALREMVDRDPLTGILNHRALLTRLQEEIARATRTRQPLAVVLFDVDRFKLLNDTHGHPVGDRALRDVAGLLAQAARVTDVVGRYGGDEFLALLPGSNADGARQFATRVLAALAGHHFCAVENETARQGASAAFGGGAPSADAAPAVGGAASGQDTIPLTASAGAAIYPLDSALPLELIALADRALYDGKHLGGNQVVIVNQALRDSLAQQDTSFGVLDGLVTAVDAKDRYTRAHSEHVAALAVGLADALGLPEAARDALHNAGLLHDVGKIGIPDHILRKPGRLSDEERRIVQQHVTLSEMIIQGVPRVDDVLAAVVHHHERWDGGGYPRGLAGEHIPLLGRVLAIADAYSAMTLDRPYRKGMAPDVALAELARAAGTQLDPALLPVFIGWAQRQPGRAAAPPVRGADARAAGPDLEADVPAAPLAPAPAVAEPVAVAA